MGIDLWGISQDCPPRKGGQSKLPLAFRRLEEHTYAVSFRISVIAWEQSASALSTVARNTSRTLV